VTKGKEVMAIKTTLSTSIQERISYTQLSYPDPHIVAPTAYKNNSN
jgi:hypothetical protein